MSDEHTCDAENGCDHPPNVCSNCGVHFPSIWTGCPRCGSTRYLDQETGVERDSATEAAS